MAAGTCNRLFLVVLCFSYLIICTKSATPFTRNRNLMQKPQSLQVPERVFLGNFEKRLKTETGMRRMEIEVNDYPGSGANNRHTPRSELGRGCIDC